MVYRQHARTFTEERSDDPDQTLLRYDASGRRGANGLDGARGQDGNYGGGHGGDGRDARPAAPGEDGGTIAVTLSRGLVDGTVELRGELAAAAGAQRLHDEVDYGDRGYVDLLAVGGCGGQGGDGGRGGDGGTGSSGSDATRYSSGSDGGSGGNGGDGGSATSGGPGGKGGQIAVRVSENDTDLLMLLRRAVAGGDGGLAGVNGGAGLGGAGGSGGSSYSWSETSYSTDAQGNQTSDTTYYSNPGGSDGPSGYNGRAGNRSVFVGGQGARGAYTIVVDRLSGEEKKYRTRYDLELVSFAHASENEDGVYEPQETVVVRDVAVRNRGGMPLPGAHDVEITLEQRGWILPEDDKLVPPRSLGAGVRYQFDDKALRFKIGDFRPRRPSEPLVSPELIGFDAQMPSVRRSFRAFEGDVSDQLGSFVIRFPTRSSPLEGLRSLAPGESGRLRWTIRNVSKRALGVDAQGARRVRVRVYANESELDDATAVLLGPDDSRLPLDPGFVHEIRSIAPGEAQDFELTLGFLEAAPHYRSVNVWLCLELGYLDDPGQLRPVQYGDFRARVARRFRPNVEAELLLVVNHRTTSDEIDAWEQLARQLGFVMNVWDLSLNGGLDLQRELAGGNLREQLAGHTIVVLNNDVTVHDSDGEKVLAAHRLVSKTQLLDAAAAGINFAFIGRGVSVERLIVPTVEIDDAGPRHTGDVGTALLERPRAELANTALSSEVTRWRFFGGKPAESYLVKRATRLQRRLSRRYPDMRFLVVHRRAPEELAKHAWIKKWREGHLEVRSMLPMAAGCFVRHKLEDPSRLHDPTFVSSDDTLMTLLLARSFEQKLARLEQLVVRADQPDEGRPDHEIAKLVIDAMLVDLANEQSAVTHATKWRGGMAAKDYVKALPCLHQLAAYQPSRQMFHLAPDSPLGREIVRLVAQLRYWAWSRFRFWEWPLMFLRRPIRMWWLTRRLTQQVLRNLFGGGDKPDALGKVNMAALRGCLKSQRQAIDVRFRNEDVAWSLPKDSPAVEEAFAERMLKAPILARGITTDAEVMQEWPVRVLSASELREIEDRDQRGESRRVALMSTFSDVSAVLRRSESTEELL